MPKLLYSATGADGKPTQGFVDAATVQEARAQLEAQGLRQVVLHSAPGIGADGAELVGLSEGDLRRLAKLRLDVMAKPGLPTALRALARQLKWWLAVCAVAAWFGWKYGSALLLWGGLIGAVAPFVVQLWQWRHVGRHNQLMKAFAIGRWPEVRRLARLLLTRRANSPAMNFDFELRVAYADAREGKLDAALERMAPWRDRVAGEPGMFESRVMMVYHAAGDDESFLRLNEEALAKLPGDPSRTVDLALAHARRGSAERAAEVLATLDKTLLPPWGAGFVHWAEGLLQLRRQDPNAATTLGSAVAELLKYSSQPAVWTALAFATVDHALALQAAGRAAEARPALAQVWPILKAHAQPALLSMLRAEGLAPASRTH